MHERSDAAEGALDGVKVAVTRPREQADAFASLLEARGAEPAVFPMIRIADSEDPEGLRGAAHRADRYDWVVFTSVNGVARFTDALDREGRGPAALAEARIACIGPATADAARREGLRPEIVPDEYVAEAVVDAITAAAGGRESLSGRSVLLPRAAGARAVLRERLEASGASVDEVEAYRAVRDGALAGELRRRLREGTVDVVTFTASSTVDNFVAAVGTDTGDARIAAIGPITARTARGHGLPVHVVAREYTIPGLIDALRAYYAGGTDTGVR